MKSYGVYSSLLGTLFFSLAAAGCSEPVGVRWTAPADGAEVYGIVELSAETQGIQDAVTVGFYLDDLAESSLIGSLECEEAAACSCLWFTQDAADGEHRLLATVHMPDGETASSIRVSVANTVRSAAIPGDAVKVSPDSDRHPPQLEDSFSDIWHDPEPLDALVNTAGGEDAPFVLPGGTELYFWFTPDVQVPPTEQVWDKTTGIYRTVQEDGAWSEPERIFLSLYDTPVLDGAHTVRDDTMWFGSAREGNYRDLDIWIAAREGGRWRNWTNAGALLNSDYQVGELHVSADGTKIYFDSQRAGGLGEKDIWVTELRDGAWQEPENIAAVNTADTEGWPFVSDDGTELWFTRTAGAPEIYRSIRQDGEWQAPERVLSSFAGEPSLDADGTLYFAHHFWDDATDSMIEADIYVCRRK